MNIYYSAVFLLLIDTNRAFKLIDPNKYYDKRQVIIDEELNKSLGGNIELTPEEMKANSELMKWKYKELDEMFENPANFNMSKSYFYYKDSIKESQVYKILQKMPKGGVLHVHASMTLGSDYFVNLTYADNLYICFLDDILDFQFADTVPSRPCPTNWELVKDLRDATGADLFDSQLKTYFALNADDTENSDIDKVWREFNAVHQCTKALLKFRPIREKHFYDALQHFYDDNIMYVEIRSGLSQLWEFNGTRNDELAIARLYRSVSSKFIKDHPDFIGVKLILTQHRDIDLNRARHAMNMAKKLKKEMPEFFAGFDFVGQEDKGKPLVYFLPVLNEFRGHLDFFFHGGESNWSGFTTDENLVDALLLGTKRIGHGNALIKHPDLINVVKNRDIALEVNVISNNVLALVQDVRNHPLATFLAMDLPVVLSSDDPGAWDSEPMSHDFYVAFMGVANRKADLRTLKQLAINSIKYSSLNEREKQISFSLFRERWVTFIQHVMNAIE